MELPRTALARRTAGTVSRWSTRGLRSQAKVDFWNNVTSSAFTPLSIDPHDRSDFDADLATIELRSLNLAKIATEGSVVRHTAQHTMRGGLVPSFLLHFQIAGKSVNHQAGRSTDLAPGDFTLVDSTRPYWLEFGSDTGFIVCRIEAAEVRLCLRNPEDLVAKCVSSASPATRILRSVLESIWLEGAENDDDLCIRESDRVVLEALALACRPLTGGQFCPAGDAIYKRALDIVNDSLFDPDLSIAAVAADLKVSTRYVQRLFALRGTTPHAYVLRQRVRRAARLLAEDRVSVTQAAMETGFNDLTHFGRAFRRQMGLSPSEYKRRAAGTLFVSVS